MEVVAYIYIYIHTHTHYDGTLFLDTTEYKEDLTDIHSLSIVCSMLHVLVVIYMYILTVVT